MGHIDVRIRVAVIRDGAKNERIKQHAVGGRVWGMGTVTDVALNGAFPGVILSDDAQQRVEVGSESSLHSLGSVRAANKDVTGERGLPKGSAFW